MLTYKKFARDLSISLYYQVRSTTLSLINIKKQNPMLEPHVSWNLAKSTSRKTAIRQGTHIISESHLYSREICENRPYRKPHAFIILADSLLLSRKKRVINRQKYTRSLTLGCFSKDLRIFASLTEFPLRHYIFYFFTRNI